MPRGSAPGERRGGRKNGQLSATTIAKNKLYLTLVARGDTPMQFFADLLRNEQAPLELRFAAARELAPYMHPRLASIEARDGGKTHEDRLEEYRRMLEDDTETTPALTGGMVNGGGG